MAEIKPKIVDGVKYWNIVDNKNLTYTDETGKVWKGKQAFNRKFEDNLISILNSEEDRLGRPLKKPEISALRRHKDIGMWLVDGDAASVQSVNAFVESLGTDSQGLPKKRKTKSNLIYIDTYYGFYFTNFITLSCIGNFFILLFSSNMGLD